MKKFQIFEEIFEGPESIEKTYSNYIKNNIIRIKEFEPFQEQLKKIKKINLIACGTSYHASLLGEYLLQEISKIEAKAEIASELRYRQWYLNPNTLNIFVSQSGESTDVLSELFRIKGKKKDKKILTLGITNVENSTLAKEADISILTKCGPEKALAATKTFLGQLTVLVLIALFFSQQRRENLDIAEELIFELQKLSKLGKKTLKTLKTIKKIANSLKSSKNIILLGRKYSFPIALEGALKIKETCYLHAEGISGGELRHGPMALIEKNFPVILIMPKDSVYEKNISLLKELFNKKANIIIITNSLDRELKKYSKRIIYIPTTKEQLFPFLEVIPLQLLSFYLAVALRREVDKPRYLSKAVIVE